VGRSDLSGNHFARASNRQNRCLQFALGLSCLLHALVYVHYRGVPVEGIDDAGSRRAAIHISLAAPANASPSDPSRFPDFTNTSFPSNAGAVADYRQAPEVRDKSVAATIDGKKKLPAGEPYYTRDMLSRSAQPISDIEIAPELLPLIPPQLLLELWIDKHGSVRKVLPIKPVQVSPSILRSFDALRFTPASRNGLPVNSRKLIELAVDGP
jgi:hypothetical protein